MPITFSTRGIAAGTLKVYFGASLDDVTYRWFSGPLVATGSTGQNTTLTEYATEAGAQSFAITVAAVTTYRYEFPTITEARFIKLKHRNTTGNYNLGEFYPRRRIQTDDLEAESIRSINVAVGQILADHISVLNLEAVSADMGDLHMDGVIDIESTGGIYQGSGSFASPTTGLKIYNSSGVGKISGYNATIEQVALDTDGKLKAGAGAVILDANGISITPTTASAALRSYKIASGATTYGGLYGAGIPTSSHLIELVSNSVTSEDSVLNVTAASPSGSDASIALRAIQGVSTISVEIVNSAALQEVTIEGDVRIGNGRGLALGGAIAMAAAGQIKTSADIQPGGVAVSYDANYNASLANNGVMALGMGNAGLAMIWAGGNSAIFGINGGAHTTTEMLDPGGIFSATAGTASSINVYWSAGNNRYEVENKRGSAISIRLWLHDAA